MDRNGNDYLEKSSVYKGFHYSVLDPNMLTYLHVRLQKMLSLLIPILDAHNIRYSVCGGTLLGAVTSGKAFPWDEDIDICVLEDDYDKMIDVILKEIEDNHLPDCFLNSSKTEPHYYHDWVKLVDLNSRVFPNDKLYINNGCWIDLYKMIRVKRSEVDIVINRGVLAYNIKRYEKGGLTQEQFLERKTELEKSLEKNSVDCSPNGEMGGDVYVIWSASKVILEEEWIFPLKEYTFEGIKVKGFCNPDGYLRSHYGDNYKVLPPEEKRRVGINKIEIKEHV